ncbi:MAG TPA: M23 family metallopeptidase [Candidatus Methylomirabilis sp.]|nr:M23 family metallopeptidase [Candidatus Methylomirabilis sp.]
MRWRSGVLACAVVLTACAAHRPQPTGVYHRVRPGQTLFRIARTYDVDAGELRRVNRLSDPAEIRVGDRLFIPRARRVLEVSVYRPEETAALEGKLPARSTAASRLHFIWPVNGKIVSRFGIEDGLKNNGIAIAAPHGTPVRAAEEGKVLYSGAELRDYGNLIVIDHEGGFATVYAHNQANLVQRGARVRKGQTIARVGMTGIAETPIVHFEIRREGKAENPLAFLK